MERRLLEPLFFIALLIGTAVVVFMLFRPFLYTLVFAGVLAYLTTGVYVRLLARLRSPSWTAGVMTLLVFFALLIPLTFVGLRIAYEASGMYTFVTEQATQERLTGGLTWMQQTLDRMLPGTQIDTQGVTNRLSSLFNWLVGSLGTLLGNFASLLLSFLLLLLFYFYLVRDGAHLKERLKELSPMASEQEDEVLNRIGRAVTATVRGSLVLAVLQGLFTGVGFMLFGIPNPALWGLVAMMAAFVPTVGTSLVQIPAVLFLIATGQFPQALGLAIWASIAVGMLDNVLGPKLMARGARMHPLVMLLAILGGVSFFGPLGVVLGPLTVSLLYALLDIYLAIIRRHEPAHGHVPIHRAARGV